MVTNEHRRRWKGRIPEHMVGVTVSVDDVHDRLISNLTYSLEEPTSLSHTPSGINHRCTCVTYDEADVGNRTFIRRAH